MLNAFPLFSRIIKITPGMHLLGTAVFGNNAWRSLLSLYHDNVSSRPSIKSCFSSDIKLSDSYKEVKTIIPSDYDSRLMPIDLEFNQVVQSRHVGKMWALFVQAKALGAEEGFVNAFVAQQKIWHAQQAVLMMRLREIQKERDAFEKFSTEFVGLIELDKFGDQANSGK